MSYFEPISQLAREPTIRLKAIWTTLKFRLLLQNRNFENPFTPIKIARTQKLKKTNHPKLKKTLKYARAKSQNSFWLTTTHSNNQYHKTKVAERTLKRKPIKVEKKVHLLSQISANNQQKFNIS